MTEQIKYKKVHFIALGITIGLLFGMPIGAIFGNVLFGLIIGLTIGITLWLILGRSKNNILIPLTNEEELKRKKMALDFNCNRFNSIIWTSNYLFANELVFSASL